MHGDAVANESCAELRKDFMTVRTNAEPRERATDVSNCRVSSTLFHSCLIGQALYKRPVAYYLITFSMLAYSQTVRRLGFSNDVSGKGL